MEYILIILIAIAFVIKYDFRNTLVARRESYWFLCIALILLSSLRYRVGGDTIRYMDLYQSIKPLSQVTINELKGEVMMPLCYLFFSFCKSISTSFYFFQLVHAIVINVIIFRFIRRHTKYIFSTVLVYILWSFLEFNTEILRESMAVCVILLGIDNIQQKKYIKYYIYCLFALGFHISAIVALLFPFVYLLRYNVVSVVILILSIIAFNIVYLALPQYFVYLDFLGADSVDLFEGYYSDEATQRNFNAIMISALKWYILPIVSMIFTTRSKLKIEYKYYGFIFLAMFLASMMKYTYAFYRFINYVMPYMWILIGTAMSLMPHVPYCRILPRKPIVYVSCFVTYLIISVYLVYMITDLEDMLKYFPYTSILNKVEVYRPEW